MAAKVIIKDTYEQVSAEAFAVMREVLKKGDPVLGLATGSTPVGLYKEMIRDHRENGTSYKNILTFNLDEYVGLPRDHEQSYYTFMHENLFNAIDIPEENVHVPVGCADDEQEQCIQYEQMLKQHKVDIQVLGIGSDGHIAFNEPGTPFESETHLMELTEQTRRDNARFFGGNIDLVPKQAITMGLSSIMRARKILLIATGANKAKAVRDMLKSTPSTACPASVLQEHPDVTVILDREAASML